MKRWLVLSPLALLALMIGFGACKSRVKPESNEILFWHWMTDRDKVFQELAQQYEQQTGVKVLVRLYAPVEAYSQNVSVGAQTNSLPDIYGILGDTKIKASFIKAGHVLRLDEALDADNGAWKKSFYKEALETSYFPPVNQFNVPQGIYGVPIDVMTIPMIYNKKLFSKAGLDPNKPPETWSQFIEAGKKLKESGVTGFVSGWAEGWLIYSMATDLAHNLMGADKVMDTFRGKVPYTDPQWVELLGAFDELKKAGFADNSMVSMLNKYAEQAFATEHSGITFNGSWSINVFEGMNPNLELGVFRVPALSNKFPRTVWGAAGSVFNVNAKSPNKEKAVAFLKWLTEPDQAKFMLGRTKNIPATKGLEKEFPAIINDFAGMMDKSIHPSRFPVSEEPKVIETFTKGIQAILIGEKTPAIVSREVQAAKEKSLKLNP